MKKFTKIAFVAATALAIASACSKDETLSGLQPVTIGESRFAIATQSTSASTGDTIMVLLTSETLDEGTISVLGSGTELVSQATEWSHSPDNKYFYSIKDNGGGVATDVVQYYLDSASGMMKAKRQYSGAEYHTWGMWGDTFATTRNTALSSSSTGLTAADYVDVVNYSANNAASVAGTYYAQISQTSYCAPEAAAATTSMYYSNNYLGNNATAAQIAEYGCNNGETATVVGFATAGDYVYASYATTGVTLFAINKSGYGWVENANGKYKALGNGSYTNSIDATNSFKATSGVPFPLTPGNTYIARYPLSGSFESKPTLIITDKMSQAFGRTTGNPLNTVVPNPDDEYVYIFSPGTMRRYSTTDSIKDSTDPDVTVDQYGDTTDTATKLNDPLYVNTDSKSAMVMRIKYGAAEFDSSFGEDGVLDFSSLMGNYTFSRVWHITGSKFLLRVIHTTNTYNVSHKEDVGDAFFYIFDADNYTATKVLGLPSYTAFTGQGNRAIGEPYIESDTIYIPMAPNTESYPGIYVVDVTTGYAEKGLEVKCSSILSVGKLVAQ